MRDPFSAVGANVIEGLFKECIRLLAVVTLVLGSSSAAFAQDESAAVAQDEKERKLGWTNVADLAFVLTSGNSATSSFALDNQATRNWEGAALKLQFGALRTKTSDDRFARGSASDFEIVEDTTKTLDNERFYVSGQYQRNLSPRFFWVAGAGWDKDLNAGIDQRSVVFGGVGHTWKDEEDLRFKTDYTLTFTRRIDDIPDAARNDRFSEARVSSDYMKKIGASSRIDSDVELLANVRDGDDYRFDAITMFTSSVSSVFALRFGVQLLYQNVPALGELVLFDPMGVRLGEIVVRKQRLDTVVKFSFVVTL